MGSCVTGIRIQLIQGMCVCVGGIRSLAVHISPSNHRLLSHEAEQTGWSDMGWQTGWEAFNERWSPHDAVPSMRRRQWKSVETGAMTVRAARGSDAGVSFVYQRSGHVFWSLKLWLLCSCSRLSTWSVRTCKAPPFLSPSDATIILLLVIIHKLAIEIL